MRYLPLLILCLILVGCGGQGTTISTNFRQGILELQVQFLDNNPPPKIYSKSSFNVMAEVHNQAAYDLKDVKVRISNLDPRYFELSPLDHSLPIMQGKSIENSQGEKQLFTFRGSAGELFVGAERYSGPFSLDISYNSEVLFGETVCINTQYYHVFDGGCTVEEKKSFAGQGAPLAITQVEQIISPGDEGSAEFRVQLQNRGKGKVKTISLKDARLGNEKLDCKFQKGGLDGNKVTLSAQEQTSLLICRKEFLGTNSYTTTLSLGFDYEYERSERHVLNLVK